MNTQAVIENWIKENGPYMYHAATPHLATAICEVGLLPSRALGHTGNYNEAVGLTYLQSRLDNVYLSAHPKKLYSGHLNGLVQPYLEIDIRDLDPAGWCIDEDHKGYMHLDNCEPWNVDGESKGAWAERHAKELDIAENIEISLGQGSISYRGAIAASAIHINPQLAHVHEHMSKMEQIENQLEMAIVKQDHNMWHKFNAEKAYMKNVIGNPKIISHDIQSQFMVNNTMRESALSQELSKWEGYDPDGRMESYLQGKHDINDPQHRTIKEELDRYAETGTWHNPPSRSLEEYTHYYIAPDFPSNNSLTI